MGTPGTPRNLVEISRGWVYAQHQIHTTRVTDMRIDHDGHLATTDFET